MPYAIILGAYRIDDDDEHHFERSKAKIHMYINAVLLKITVSVLKRAFTSYPFRSFGFKLEKVGQTFSSSLLVSWKKSLRTN